MYVCVHTSVCSSQLLSHVQLFVTPWIVIHQAPLSVDSLGKHTGVGCHFLPRASSLPRGQTRISCASYIGRWVLYHCDAWEALPALLTLGKI